MSLTIWSEPDPESAYVMGVDTAEGLSHGDFSVIEVVDVKTGEQVAEWHGHIPPDELAHEVFMLGLWYRDALCCVESNNHGLTTITILRQLGYPNLFRRRSLNQATNKISQEYGWKTTRTSKPLMIDDLSMALRNYELVLRSKGLITELRTFVRNERGSMNGSPYDDRVMAFALANQMRKFVNAPENAPAVNDYLTFDWWVRQADSGPTTTGPIGSSAVRGTPLLRK